MWRVLLCELYIAEDSASVLLDSDRLHGIEDELMSTAKYQFSESDYITVITYSKASRSGTIALF
jgi:hypothetical protein